MVNRLKKMFTISRKDYEYLEQLKDEHNFKYLSDALEFVIKEYEKNADITTEYIIKNIVEKVCERISDDLLKIKKVGNSSDRHIQIMIEMLNGMFFKQQYGEIVTTTEDKCPALKIATDEVNKRIINSRVKKLDSKYQKKDLK